MCSLTGVGLRLGDGATDERKTTAETPLEGLRQQGLSSSTRYGFSLKAPHTVSHTAETGTTGTGLHWLPGTAASILCVSDTWVNLYLQGPPKLKIVYTKNSLLSLTETSESNY